MMRRWPILPLALAGCTVVVSQPGDLTVAEPGVSQPAAPATLPDQVAVDDEPAPTPKPVSRGEGCADEEPIIATIANAETGAPRLAPHRDDETYTYAFTANLDGQPMRVDLPIFEFTMFGRGNGNIVDIDALDFGGGAVILSHHNLDEVVDPPRFFRSRWSEAYWLPATSESGDCPQAIALEGNQHQTAWSPSPESLCIANALGQTRRLTLNDGTLREESQLGVCAPRLARQRDWGHVRDEILDTHKRSETEDEVSKTKKFTLGSKLDVFAIDVQWSCEACHENPKDAPVYKSTRLVVADRRGDVPRTDVYYASVGRYCTPKRRGKTLQCGEQSFAFPGDGVVTVGTP